MSYSFLKSNTPFSSGRRKFNFYGPYIKNISAYMYMNLKSSIDKLQKSRLHIKTLKLEILYG